MRPFVLILALLVLSACAAPLPPSAVPPSSLQQPLASGEMALSTDPPIELPSGAVAACGGIGLSAVLHGAATDPHLAWLVNDLGKRLEVTWPPGYRARLAPDLEVLDAEGVVVLREGDAVSGGCVTGEPGSPAPCAAV